MGEQTPDPARNVRPLAIGRQRVRALTRQNQQLRARLAVEMVLVESLRRSQNDFRSLAEQSAEAEARQNLKLHELLRSTESILSTLDPREVIIQIAEQVGAIIPCDNLAVETIDATTGLLTPIVANGESADYYLEPWKEGETGIATWVIEHDEAVLILDQSVDERVNHQEGVGPVAGGLIVVPLRGRGHASGVLTLERLGEGQTFSTDEFELAQLFAAQVSIALRNAEIYQTMKIQTLHDTLTGLANRTLFADRLDHALGRAQRSGRHPAVLFIDLDDFKTVNDSLGHGEGDRLLISVAERFTTALRPEDTVARLGGDEFAVLIEDQAGDTTALEVAQRILGALVAPFTQAGKDLFVRASVGLALADGSKTANDLLRDADLSMYAAKDRGKGRVEVFDPAMAAAANTRLQLKGDLEYALERNEFELLYQPIIDLSSGFVSSVEALIRWDHPTMGRVNPVDFIPLAEETGAIVPIGAWCLEMAVRQVLAWDALGGPRISASVNVCSRQIALGQVYVDQVADLLARTGLDPTRLSLEVTESMLLDDTETVIATTTALKGLGVQLSLDDFGTGYSSLSYLRRFPFDSLKIDRSFVMAMDSSPEQMSLTNSILKLASDLHLKTVAEGIEEPAQLATLCAMGTDYGQGYLFARPMTVAAFGDLLRAGARLDPLGTVGVDGCATTGIECPIRIGKTCASLCQAALVGGGQLRLVPQRANAE